MTYEEKMERLIDCIRAHCPRIALEQTNAIDSFANHIIVSHENSEDGLGVSADAATLSKLKTHLVECIELLESLTPTTKRKLNYRLPRNLEHQPKLFGKIDVGSSVTADGALFGSYIQRLSKLTESVGELSNVPAASTKLNYRAAVVAAACKKVWREELAGKEPPLQIGHNRRHPMKSFIEAVFDILSIGCEVSSALNSLKLLGGEEAIRLSIEVG